MPPTSERPKTSFHALVTGYGPFEGVPTNPSWLATAPLHDTIIETPSSSVHVTAVGPLKVAYGAVLSVVANVHARPPRLPIPGSEVLDGSPPNGPAVPPPPAGYDFVFHLGVGHPGDLFIEQVGHKSGYQFPGVDGEDAPVISTDKTRVPNAPSPMHELKTSRISQFTTRPTISMPPVKRGFAKGYERFPEELHTEVDVPGVIEHLKRQGETRVYASTDAGSYLCGFITYGSLAESQRPLFYPSAGDNKNSRRSKSLFMHVPPAGYPYTIAEMTEAVRQIVAWVCTKEKVLPQGPHT